jgi:hypothetical protein
MIATLLFNVVHLPTPKPLQFQPPYHSCLHVVIAWKCVTAKVSLWRRKEMVADRCQFRVVSRKCKISTGSTAEVVELYFTTLKFLVLFLFAKHNTQFFETVATQWFIECLITWRKWRWLQVFILRVGHYTHRHSSGKRPWTRAFCSVQISWSLFYLAHIVGKFLSSTLSYKFGWHVEAPKLICRTKVLTCL